MKKIEEMSDIELKATKSDIYEAISIGQQNLQIINSELQKRAVAAEGNKKTEDKKK